MRLAIVKPDYKIAGGFEIVISQIKRSLETAGYAIDEVKVDMTNRQLTEIPMTVAYESYAQNPEFFNYVNGFLKFRRLNLDKYDLVLSTQPPSFVIDHPNHVCVFYHHQKIYYDLSEIVMEVGLVNPQLHKLAVRIIRDIERPCLEKVNLFLAGSYHVKKRLEFFQQKKLPVEVFYAGIDREYFAYQGPRSFQEPICVGRHEFPKRPELFIQGMKYLPQLKGKVIGSGGKTAALKKLDAYLTYIYGFRHEEYPSEAVWKKLIFELDALNLESYLSTAKKYNLNSNVELTGNVGKTQLIREYANALCVVCPAYEEDYGLTAIEAMAFGKPVIACTDGGGYRELVEHGKTGFIVEPTARAIAEAIQYLIDNPEKLREISENAYEKSREFSWDRANARLRQLVEGFGS